MSISSYTKNGVVLYRVYTQARGKENLSLRIQKSKKNISTLAEAKRLEKQLIRLATEEVGKIEGKGLTWGDILERWELQARSGLLGEKYRDRSLLQSHISRLHQHTFDWFRIRGSDLGRGDGRRVLACAKEMGKKAGSLRQIKASINVVHKFGVEEGFIAGNCISPVSGIFVVDKTEKVPKILTLEEIRFFLNEAKVREHEWYPVWALAVMTGMRSGELFALEWSDVDFQKKIIRVSKSFHSRSRKVKSTKAGYWRNVPISKDLEELLRNLMKCELSPNSRYVLPRHSAWLHGDAGLVLRLFLKSIGIKVNVVFHTLRACFATHMLAAGVDQAKVMKIGGWKDIKTFQIYVRLAGVDVADATDALNFLPQQDQSKVIQFMGS